MYTEKIPITDVGLVLSLIFWTPLLEPKFSEDGGTSEKGDFYEISLNKKWVFLTFRVVILVKIEQSKILNSLVAKVSKILRRCKASIKPAIYAF